MRLRIFDRGAVQVDTGFDRELGLWDDAGTFQGSAYATTVDLKALVSGALRIPVVPRLELSFQIPYQYGYRAAGDVEDWGHGPGDLSIAARYTLVETGDHDWPGLGLVLGGLLPTGRDASDSQSLLGADITGRGTYRYGAEFWAEYQNGPLYLAAVPGIANTPLPESFGGGNELEISGRVIVGWTLANKIVLAGNVQVTRSPSHESSFGTAPAKGRPSATIAASVPVGESWFVQVSTGMDLPISGIGVNESSLIRAQIGLRYALLSED